MHLASGLPLLALPLALAKTISIGVGKGGLVFDPEVVTANTGDFLQFSFYPKNHSVVQSSFSSPCQPLAGGVYSGFEPVAAGVGDKIFQVTVSSTDPIYLYCSQIQQCEHGMVMVINPPSYGGSLAAYKAAAVNASSVSPRTVAGGVFIDATTNATSTSNTTSTSSNSSTSGPTSSPVIFTGGAIGNEFLQRGLLGSIVMSGLVLAAI